MLHQKRWGTWTEKNKLRWYPQQPQRFMFTNLSESQPWEPCWTWPGPSPKIPKTFSGTFSATFSGTRWAWLGFAPRLPGTFSGTFSGTLLNPGSAPKPSRPFPEPSRNPVEPDLALHQSLLNLVGEPSLEPCWTWPEPPGTFSGTFSGTLLNSLCTKASQTFSGTFFGTLLNLTWVCTKAFQNLLWNLLQNPVEPDLALHQSLPDLLRNLPDPVEPDLGVHQSLSEPSLEPSPEPCWTWPGSAPKPPRPSPEPSEPSPEPLPQW